MNSLIYVLNFIVTGLKYALFLIIGFIFISLILLSGTYKNFKIVYNLALEGKNNLTMAISETKTKNWDKALEKSQLAENNFSQALVSLENSRNNLLINKISFFQNQVNDLEYLLKTTEIISRSLGRSIPIIKGLEAAHNGTSGNNYANLKKEETGKFLKLIYESEPELNGLKANLDIALFNINKIHKIGILWPLYKEITEYKVQIQEASVLISRFTPLIKLLPALGGYPTESNFLILLQNNDELRPTGGFIGVYGLAKTKNGEIISLTTNDSYHLDMPAVGKWQKEAPAPIKKYLKVENWYLRDANWIPDWPLAAQKINEIYTGENLAIGQSAPNFAGIIAINPDFISSLINLVGTINVQGEDYTPQNFQELLQYNVEIAYKDRDISSWNRKNIINELLAELKLRIFTLPTNKWPQLLKIIDQNINEKNIQLYFFNQNLESLAKDIKASGEIQESISDYLMVVDANLAAFKSDAVLKKKIIYNVHQANNQAISNLSLIYRHEGDFDWRTTRYRSYTRALLPLGSRLINSTGLDENQADLSVTDDQILNKTIFGFFFTVEPGTEKEITINYYLPNNITQQLINNKYELLVQKQSGRRTEELNINIKTQKGNNLIFKTDLNTDKIFR